MSRFIEGEARSQSVLFPERLDDWIADDNPVRAVDALVDELDLAELGFEGAEPAATGRPAYHPAMLLKIYVYGHLNRLPSSRRLEREAQRNVKLMWLTGRLAPDFETIADFRRNNGTGIRNVCRRFVLLCRDSRLCSQAIVASDSSKFKVVNSRDRNFTPGKVDRRQQQIEESIQRYLDALETADGTQPYAATNEERCALECRPALHCDRWPYRCSIPNHCLQTAMSGPARVLRETAMAIFNWGDHG